jgi:exopolysaccharide biosynthesis polyprenyl glycosylphosphotransferase
MSEIASPQSTLGTLEGLPLRARAKVGVVQRGDLFWRATRLGLDVVLLAAAAVLSTLASPAAHVDPWGIAWQMAFASIILLMSVSRGVYAPHMRVDVLENMRSLVIAVVVATMAIVTARVMIEPAPGETSEQAIRLAVFAAVYLAAGRFGLDTFQKLARRAGEAAVPTLIVGAGRVGRTTAKRLLEHSELGLKPIGFLDKEPREDMDDIAQLPVLGASWDFEQVVSDYDVGQVIITFSTAPNEVLLRIVKRSEELGVGVSLVPRLYEKITDRLTIDHLGGLPLLTAHPSDPRGWQYSLKYGLDRLLALLIVIAAAPIMLVATLAVWISLGRPLLFRQLRVGRDGRAFEMLKFRSMLPREGDAADDLLPEDIAPGGIEGGDRRTRLGAFLRKSSIDELPQLLNVLKGDMSLVGPRPERPEYVELFEDHIYRYGERHRVKSGITGWAQIHGLRGKTSLTDRVEWDNYYIENWSLWLDVKIMLRTALTIVGFFKKVK